MCQTYRLSAHNGSATSGCASTRSRQTPGSDKTGRRIGPFNPATKASGARSPSRMCWIMWKNRNSCSPKASIGETSASRTRTFPVAKLQIRQRETGVPARASVRTRRAYRSATTAVGTICSGSKDQLVSREGTASTGPKSRIRMMEERGATYEQAGVSIEKGEAVVERIRAAVESTGATGFGAFAGLFPLDDERLLAASTDSIGTKPIVARPRGKLRNCGADMAAHCINDVATCGAEPLFLLDYVASERVQIEQVAELVEGAAEVCRAAGCALIGGETAEMPDVYREDELDFAATCVGIVDRERLVDGSRVEAGDAVVGFPSAGVHANGFTLVRSVLEEEDYDGDDLLAPTRLYLDDVRRLRERAHAFAHVTGGGILGNLSRVLPDGLRAELDWDAWQRPPVFAWLARHVGEDELRRVFNLGIGFCAVVRDPGDELVIG